MAREIARRQDTAPVRSLFAFALGAVAIGAIAVGAIAIGRVAVGRMAIGKARFKSLEVDELTVGELTVGKLNVTEQRAWKPEAGLPGQRVLASSRALKRLFCSSFKSFCRLANATAMI